MYEDYEKDAWPDWVYMLDKKLNPFILDGTTHTLYTDKAIKFFLMTEIDQVPTPTFSFRAQYPTFKFYYGDCSVFVQISGKNDCNVVVTKKGKTVTHCKMTLCQFRNLIVEFYPPVKERFKSNALE